MFRKRLSKRRSGKIFNHTAKKIHKKNITRSGAIRRGGIKL